MRIYLIKRKSMDEKNLFFTMQSYYEFRPNQSFVIKI